ncbi:S-layer homology domain-containing protein [Anoxybacterium hadale]|uniref:S-layer homology domain-containing protein n=1 Tax=Anoxybacterium hadale TaxID=3408580 RepID=A0ACD1AAM2_9FIRM|nr:S-layer homology domain-containing protein [Clostridiales bacterium]
MEANLTITPATVTVTADAKSKAYGAADPELTYTSSVEGLTFTGELEREAGEDVGTYKINQGSLSAGANYTVTYVEANLTITPATVTVTADAKSKAYGAADPELTYTSSVEGLTFTGELEREAGEDVGTYKINQGSLALKDNGSFRAGNYTLSYIEANLSIAAGTGAELNVKNYNNVYDAKAYSITVGSLPENGNTILYSQNETDWSEILPTFTSVTAEKIVYVKVLNPNYVERTGTGTVIINPRPITLTAKSAVLDWTGAPLNVAAPGYEITAGTLAEGQSITSATVSEAQTESGTYETTVGEAEIGENTSNYEITYVKGSLVINQLNMDQEVSSEGYEGVYDGTGHGIKVSAPSGATVTYDVENSMTNVGEGTVTYTVTKPGYKSVTGSAMIRINPREITITANSKSKRYDGTPLTDSGYSVTKGTVAAGDNIISVTVIGTQTSRGTSDNIAKDAVIMDGETNVTSNYDILYAKGTLNVTRRSSGGGDKDNTTTITDEEVPGGPLLNMVDHYAYIQGYPDETVRPQGNITREEVAAVFFRLLDPTYRETIRTTEEDYSDVAESRWSVKHIGTLSNGQVLTGYADGSFRPGAFMTKAELATVASRFDALSEPGDVKFSDVSGHWAEKYILSAAAKGWVKGYEDGTFKPDQYITRAEFVTLVNNVLERSVQEENILPDAIQFKDLQKGKWYYEAMQEAINSHNYERAADGFEKWTEIFYPVNEM